MAGLKSTKGKLEPTNIQKKKPGPIAVDHDDSDDSSILSYLDDSEDNKMNGSDNEDEENDDDENVEQMSDREATEMFNDEVFSSCSSIHLRSETILPSCPRLQMIQHHCSTMTMT